VALVETSKQDGIVVLTLNRPEAMNALSRALQRELHDAIDAADNDPEVRVIILTGAGERAFSAGVDLKELAARGFAGRGDDEPRGGDPGKRLMACSKPTIAAINGVAITGGFEIAMACDIQLASTNARFADTHVRVGVTPGWALSQVLSRRIGSSRAKELSLSGNFIDAATAERWGLVNRVVAPAQLLPAALQLAADIASCDADMVRRYKALIDDGFDLPYGQATALELKRAAEDNAKVTAESVARVREGIMSRGRVQHGG
jgi:enoyl-CoA hydratase